MKTKNIFLALLLTNACKITVTEIGPDCNDGVDNDEDGLTDCADPTCSEETVCTPVCGNNQLDEGELCDDGNTAGGDGCSADCASDETCGNGVSDPGEECDDGDVIPGDGCDATCNTESCGDGVVNNAGAESCDDGNTTNGDGCNSTCDIEVSQGCGDGIVQANEECDDGDIIPGDGCNAACQEEFCGDGIVNNAVTEECDDGNTTSGDGCDATCSIEGVVAAVCGNGVPELGEQCDDGNNIPADGCSSACQFDFPPLCGDGHPVPGEGPCFEPAASFGVGDGPRSAALGDFNGDGHLDIVTPNNITNTVSVLLGDGAGSFGAKTDFFVGQEPYLSLVVDINQDGKLDIATTKFSGPNVGILLNTTATGAATPTFASVVNFAASSGASGLDSGDFNGDGKPDLVTGNLFGNDSSVLINTTGAGAATATFAATLSLPGGSRPTDAVVGRFNADAFDDIAAPNFNNGNQGSISVYLGNGDGTFGARTEFIAGGGSNFIEAGDFDSDGKTDLVVANQTSTFVSVLFGNGNGTFSAPINFEVGGTQGGIGIGDVNSDGNLDVMAAVGGINSVSLLLGDGNGGFAAATFLDLATGTGPIGRIDTGDILEDGAIDILVAAIVSDSVSIFFGNP